MSASPAKLRNIIARCFSREELDFLERSPVFVQAEAAVTTLDGVEHICKVGQDLLDADRRAGYFKSVITSSHGQTWSASRLPPEA